MSAIDIALVFRADSPFVQRDREALRTFASVKDVLWKGKRSIPALASAVMRADVSFSWFAEDHAFGACRIAKIAGRRAVVVVGGGDAAARPDLGYGVHLDPKRGARSRYVLSHADRVLIVDDSLREEIAKNTGIRRPEIQTVPLGFNTDRFQPGEGARTTVLTVGIVSDTNLTRKGLLTFVEAARRLPEIPFVLVGIRANAASDRLRQAAPDNVRLTGYLTDDELVEEYRKARVYVQASSYEGLPTALGEAMACGCIPVGTKVAGIPSLIGDTGYYCRASDSQDAGRAIQDAYETGDGSKARARIVREFSEERRRTALRAIVEELVR